LSVLERMGRTSILAVGLLLFLFSLPLAWRKVPMNRFYGFRTEAAFKSAQTWYDVNAFGGRLFLLAGLLLIALGAAGFYLPEQHRDTYARYAPLAVVIVISLAVLRVMWWSRRYGS
jgi:uncharacterized membrane protein